MHSFILAALLKKSGGFLMIVNDMGGIYGAVAFYNFFFFFLTFKCQY